MAENDLAKEQERLAKLWDAYEVQEREYREALKKITRLENELREKDRINETLRKVSEARDREIRELEVKIARLEDAKSTYEPKLEELTKMYKSEKERYAKLFALAEELEGELTRTRKAIEERDRWFLAHVGILKNVDRAVRERESMIEATERLPSADAYKPGIEKLKLVETVEVEREEVQEPERTKVIAEFKKLGELDDMKATALYNAGFTSVDKIKDAATREIAAVEGFDPELARKLRTRLYEKTTT
jgi:septal ring factor EnvC (AmiA/AmiB activator)